ncbi:E3 ubiquitin-protein ligase HRD1 [Culicoides brevitarsis]|uniref:E3 ubiquitin-protein ligase HRD1 n=1 Tax=Culicoides brevitarsis TaxID=469753 RepID=UPI00307C303F
MLKMRSLGISLVSICLTLAVISNAYYQKKQFYPSVVYITKSNPSMVVIYVQSLVLVLMLGKLIRKIFLGQLRAAEVERLMERFWYALTETCLAFTVFRDDFNPKFVALFTVLLFLKSFHWLAEERVDYMERSPVIGWLFHIRVSSLLSILGLLDYYLIAYAYQSTVTKGATVQLVFGFEYAVLITMVINAAIKYVLHAAELRSDTPWENKAVFLLYTELIIGFIRVVLYIIFVALMVKIYTLPLFAFRPMYYTMRNFKKALNDVILSRRAIRNMNTLYPDATPEELSAAESLCIICRENMVNNSKKLPCGHIFHTPCLRSWFQRQQTCPTCRLNILRAPVTADTNQPGAPANVNAGNNNDREAVGGAANNNNVIPPNPFLNFMGAAPPFMNLMGNPPPANAPNTNSTAVPLVPGSPLILPPFPCITPYAVPPPPMPPNLDTLTDDELRLLEGNERRNVEERIKLLRNIQLMMDASVALMNQYSAITARLPPLPPPTTITQPTTSSATSDPQPGPSSSSSTPVIQPTAPTLDIPSTSSSTPTRSPKVVTEAKLEDVGSEDYLDLSPKDTKSRNLGTQLEHVEDPNDPVSELRRRRLQKFLQQEANGNSSKD